MAELILDTPMNLVKVNDLASGRDEVVLLISNAPVGHSSMMAVLDRQQQRQLYQFLKERVDP